VRPALAAIPGVLGGPAPVEAALVENALAIALLRADRSALEGFAHPGRLCYWRRANGREIDFLATDPPLVAVESKYASHRTGKDYESLTKAFGRGDHGEPSGHRARPGRPCRPGRRAPGVPGLRKDHR